MLGLLVPLHAVAVLPVEQADDGEDDVEDRRRLHVPVQDRSDGDVLM